ncbi:MAG: NTP transferase domain-containing protein [Acidobacteriota bacterium]
MIAAIVLAAGQASRFGQSKQLVRLGEKTLLEYVLGNLDQSTVDEVIVVLGANSERIRAETDFGDARVLDNAGYAQGMSTSIQAGLRALGSEADAALIVLADQPFVAPATLNRLCDEYRRTRSTIVIPTYKGLPGNPVIVGKELFPEMMTIRGDVGCRSIFAAHAGSITRVELDDRGVITDIDTVEDLESARELVAGAPRLLTLSGATPSKSSRDGVIDVPMQCYSGGLLDVLIEPDLTRPQIVVVGYEPVARALVRISKALSFHVTVVDPLATNESVPEADAVEGELNLPALSLSADSFVVIATHGRYDEEALEQAAHTGASYIALVSSPQRAGVVLQQLRDRGMSEEALSRIKSPAGLDIGAQSAEEIALSIVAEIVQKRRAFRAAALAAQVDPDAETVDKAIAEAVDPICNMTVSVADARYTSEHEGRRYYFCCLHCQRTFEQEPQRYAHVA